MTAEVAIYNRSAITLAADSAVSISSGQAPSKIYNNAEKLFAITKYHPVGLMIYGSSDLLGIPLELVVKQHRVKLGKRSFSTLDKYASSFFSFIEEFLTKLNPISYEHEYQDYFDFIISDTFDKIVEYKGIQRPNQSNTADMLYRFNEGVDHLIDLFEKNTDFYCKFNNDDIIEASKDIEALAVDILNDFFNIEENAQQEPCKSFILLCALRICKVDILYDKTTGLVFAGYGDNEYFPQMYNYEIYGIYNGKLK
ncbi:hypothetical protein, partial [Vibrio cholerae]